MMIFKSIDGSSSAAISECGRYRYSLCRGWNYLFIQEPRPFVLWIMLNPSTADHIQDDPTIRRCKRFTDDWGFKRLVVCNLFALRSQDPGEVKKNPDPVGPENDAILERFLKKTERTVCAWGNHGSYLNRSIKILKLCKKLSVIPYCLGITKHGQPRHPLYIPGNKKLEELKIDLND